MAREEDSMHVPKHNCCCCAQERIATLEQQMAMTAAPGAASVSSDALKAKVLAMLKDVQQNLAQALSEQTDLKSRHAQVVQERDRLAVENAKLKYQNLHLTRAVKAADQTNETLKQK
eukprot:jgi/Chlat1/3208/Chrsp22S08804